MCMIELAACQGLLRLSIYHTYNLGSAAGIMKLSELNWNRVLLTQRGILFDGGSDCNVTMSKIRDVL